MNLSKVTEPRGEQKLLSAVIALALEDATSRPGRGIPPTEVTTALEFLFAPGVLDGYMLLLDMDVGMFRQNLLNAMYADPVRACGTLSDTEIRAIRINYERLLAVKQVHAL